MFLFKDGACQNYKVLNEADRAQGNARPSHSMRSDDNLVTGWYRFQGAAGDRMPDKCVLPWRCGTTHPGWLKGKHPTAADGKVTRKICFTGRQFCCRWSLNIKVKNCGGYYVYRLMNTARAQFKKRKLSYCGNAGAGKLYR